MEHVQNSEWPPNELNAVTFMKSWDRIQLIKQPINFANLNSVFLLICWWRYCEWRLIAGMGGAQIIGF